MIGTSEQPLFVIPFVSQARPVGEGLGANGLFDADLVV
jgi:hypothetical protein